MMARWPLIAALLLSACGAAATPGDDNQVAAMAGAEPQLRAMLPMAMFSGQTMAMAAYASGIEANCAVVRPAFETAVAKYLPTWRANLVKAYRDNVPAETLAKATADARGAASAAMMPYRDKIAAQMQAASMPVLVAAATDVTLAATKAAAGIDIKMVDGAKRMAEMNAAQADGSLFCGLRPDKQETR